MTSPMSRRDARIVLWLCCAAAVWRWFVALRTPLPGVSACGDLWVAGQLAHGAFGELASAWLQPWWSLLLLPAIAAGVPPFLAAQVAGCLLGGLAVWPVALAAERLREGAGVPAAVLAMVAAGPTVAAGAGSAAAGLGLAVATAAAFASRGCLLPACGLGALVACGGGDALVAGGGMLRTLRLAVGAALLLVPLAWLPPRPLRARGLQVALLAAVTAGVVAGDPVAWWPTWSPLAAVLAGVGLVRLSARWREVLLCAAVAGECHGAWNEVEPRAAIAERAIGRFVAHRLPPGGQLASDLPRVLWAAGQRPAAWPGERLADAAAAPDVFAIVLGPAAAHSSTLAASLAGRFARYELPTDLADLVTTGGLRVLIRR